MCTERNVEHVARGLGTRKTSLHAPLEPGELSVGGEVDEGRDRCILSVFANCRQPRGVGPAEYDVALQIDSKGTVRLYDTGTIARAKK